MVYLHPRNPFSYLLSLLLGCALLLPARANAGAVPINIKIIYAHVQNRNVDPKLKELVAHFSKLSFTAYQLEDEVDLALDLGSSSRLQLPNKEWMAVKAMEMSPDGKLRLEMTVEKLKFKTTASIAPGATLAVGGPTFEKGALILAITRAKDKP